MTDTKICGIKSDDVLEAAIAAGARWVGLVLYGKSPRNMPLETAAALADLARGRASVVVLLVDPGDDLVADVVRSVGPDLIQLHGSETPERVAAIRATYGVRIIKAVGVRSEADVRAALAYYRPNEAADMLLFDAKPPEGSQVPGGHGIPFDWRILAAVPVDMPYMLAGGLTPDNVREAILKTGAPAVDVSSGVETAPGEKSVELIGRFLQAVKTAKETL
ncbi:MAG: phosphoribosylanthranilate isomerase [Hyphomicrobiaceae bacterium]|nr:phosphoribosylanthranilate isomerase [Hyphomicrobiaceae bacterium]